MAKGSAMGLWRGKKGSSVFFKIKNSNSAQKQGIRERVYEVSNPQSIAQASQRMKLLPAQRIATLLKSVIERGFEGVEYGVKSRNKFLQYALKMTEGFPATDKDSSVVYPGRYLIAKGSLPEVECTMNDGSVGSYPNGSFLVNLYATRGASTLATVGSLAASLLENNPSLQEGDQLTFVMCEGLSDDIIEDSRPVWRVVSIFLYTDDARTMAEAGLSMLSIDTSRMLMFTPTETTFRDGYMAAACIVSREPEGLGHLRSDATIAINANLNEMLFGSSSMARARASYRSTSDVNNDWPVQDEATASGLVGTVDGTYTLSGFTGLKAECNGQECKVLYNAETGALVGVYYRVWDGKKCLCTENGYSISYPVSEGSSTYTELLVSDVAAFSGKKQVLFTAGA